MRMTQRRLPKGNAAVLAMCILVCAAAPGSVARAQSAPPAGAARSPSTPAATVLPDIVGIRPGISAQQAYDLLKSHNPRARFGIGQWQLPGVSDKKISVALALDVVETQPHETITVWLTIPPGEQVVWAVARRVEYEQDKPLLRETVVSGLRQKYGSETNSSAGLQFWSFDEQGHRLGNAAMNPLNCIGHQNWSLEVIAPTSPTFDFFTPLIYFPGPRNPCDSLVEVKARVEGPVRTEYVSRITVVVQDLGMARRSQEAYQASLKNAAMAKDKEELEKAKQRKGPEF